MRRLFHLSKQLFKQKLMNKMQEYYQKRVVSIQLKMGIGVGAEVESSGEGIVISYLQKNFQPPYCIFDVGSNIGQYINLILKKLPDNDYSIHSFEPASSAFHLLKQKYQTNPRIKLNNWGLSKNKEVSQLFYDFEGSGLASLSKRRLDHFGITFNKSETVKLDTLDNYCTQNKINEIHLMKLDIEGHELDALNGALEMLTNHHIHIVTFEFGGCDIDTRTYFQDFYYFFQGLDMNIYRILSSGYLYPLNDYKEVYEQFRTTNYAAISHKINLK